MALSAYALQLVAPYNYSGILPPGQFPTVQNYPGLATAIAPAQAFLIAAQTVLESLAQTSAFPSSVSYGYVSQLVTQGNAVLQTLDALSPAPYLFNAEVLEVVLALQTITLYPELLSI